MHCPCGKVLLKFPLQKSPHIFDAIQWRRIGRSEENFNLHVAQVVVHVEALMCLMIIHNDEHISAPTRNSSNYLLEKLTHSLYVCFSNNDESEIDLPWKSSEYSANYSRVVVSF